MRISCNGCRVLRKGCSKDCCLRPCLEWFKSPESQANATFFLAKFYGRAGLINLIIAAPIHRRTEIFRSLLYEACGRIINPVYGAVGLMASGDWSRCHASVEEVLRGAQLTAGDDSSSISPLQGCDIRHISAAASDLDRVRTQNRRKQSTSVADSVAAESLIELEAAKFTVTGWDRKDFVKDQESERAPSHDSFSVETVVEPCLMKLDDEPPIQREPKLELSLGL